MPKMNPITTQKDFKTFGQGKTYIICFMSDECPHCMPHIKTVKEASKHTTTPVTFLDMTRDWHHKVFDNVVTTLSLQPNVPLLVKRAGGEFYKFNNDWANIGDFFASEPDTRKVRSRTGGTPQDATDGEIDRAKAAHYAKMARDTWGIPQDATDEELDRAKAAHYGGWRQRWHVALGGSLRTRQTESLTGPAPWIDALGVLPSHQALMADRPM